MASLSANMYRNDKDARRHLYKHSNPVMEALQIFLDFLVLTIQVLWYALVGLFRLFVPVPKKSVQGEVVLITGTAHGIGKELAFLYSSQGATVVCWDINEKGNQETVKEIAALGYTRAYAFQCNVADRDDVLQVAKRVQQQVGDVTIIINNAGIMPCHPFLQHSADEIQRIMNTNVMAHFWILQAFLPAMIEKNRGHIVAISSGCGLLGLRYLVPYCTSKFAVRGMMEVLYQELYANPNCQIKLTTVFPYMVDTGLCKKPVMRFPNLMKLLSPKEVARTVNDAQRRELVEVSVPQLTLYAYYFIRLFPMKASRAMQAFCDFYVDSDL